jgi:hypothetical protein
MKHLLTWALVLTSLSAFPQTKLGHIRGTVVDQDGNPVPAATVYVMSQEVSLDEITPPSAKSDGNGNFNFSRPLELGSYKIWARKTEDLYPEPLDEFYKDPKAVAAKADLTDDHSWANITVTLGDKAAVLEGTVIDSVSGKPTSARLAFLDQNGNGHVLYANGEYHMLLPSGKDLSIMVIGIGPEEKSQMAVNALRLDPGQEMRMDIPVSKQ